MMLRAGLEGIRQELDPGEPHPENMYAYTPQQLEEMRIMVLPRNLFEAVESFAADPLSREVFGDAMYNAFIDYKQGEWHEYHNDVSNWERERYLTMF